MNNESYAEFVRTGNFTEGARDGKFLAAMGLAGEGGEVCDYLKKVLLHGKPFDRGTLVGELGDVLWYLQHACNVFDIPFEEVMEENVRKLCDRYPNKYGDPDEWIEGGAGDVIEQKDVKDVKDAAIHFNNALLKVRDSGDNVRFDVIDGAGEYWSNVDERCRLSLATEKGG